MVKAGLFFLLISLHTPVLSGNSPQKKDGQGIKKIVIDAGHGGHDPGCHGAKSKEKEVCLSIALQLGKLINEAFKDVEVIYTRDKDVFVELHERAEIANRNHADLFICIHANSGGKEAYGAETFVMGLHKSEANLLVAKRENSVILMEDDYKASYEGFDPNSDEDIIALTLMQSTYLDQSLNFANKIQTKLLEIGRKSRGVKQAGFLVLYKTAMPSVLIETGFLTNAEEEKFLADEKNQGKMAQAFFSAFKEYKEQFDSKNINTPNVTENKKPVAQDTLKKPQIALKKAPPAKEEPKKPEIFNDAISLQLPDTSKKNKSSLKSFLQKDTLTLVSIDTTKPIIKEKEVDKPAEEIKKVIIPSKNNDKPEPAIKEIHKDNKIMDEQGIVFRVQIKSSAKQLALKPENFMGLSNVFEYVDKNGVYKYTVGESDNVDELIYLQNTMKQKGYKDAFIIAFKNQVRIPTQEAIKILKNKN